MTLHLRAAVTNTVDDVALAEMLDGVSADLPSITRQVLIDPGDFDDLDQAFHLLDAVTALAKVHRAELGPDTDPPEESEASDFVALAEIPEGDIHQRCALIAWCFHKLSTLLNDQKARRYHFDALLTAYGDFRSLLDLMLSAQRHPEKVRVSNL